MLTRRQLIRACSLSALGMASYNCAEQNANVSARRFHIALTPQETEGLPELLGVIRDAGVSDVWFGAFFYGHWVNPPERIAVFRQIAREAGLAAHAVNVPVGHPGDSLGDITGSMPLNPPGHWQMGVRPDGTRYSGSSLHAPAIQENVAAIKGLHDAGVDAAFLDDDFRLALSPGQIGGCFGETHRLRFLGSHGYSQRRWSELLADVGSRNLSPILRNWIEFTCDELTDCFRQQQAAAPGMPLGNMVMYLGSEKAGIRLSDYRDVPLRVGELMFNDKSFAPVRNKTKELFSSLFHRRFVSPESSYSETTAFPADQLSARNLAAKLAVSTLSDVRNTMFMSGVTPFPADRWDVLKPAMRKHAEIHGQVAGHLPRGPFKHYWGEASHPRAERRALCPGERACRLRLVPHRAGRTAMESFRVDAAADPRERPSETHRQGRRTRVALLKDVA